MNQEFSPATMPAPKKATDRKGRILVVDDEEINVKILRVYLEEKGYEVVGATNGEQAIRILGSEPVDVLICDIRMPGISGIEVLNWVQQHCPIVPVIMLTGFIDINTAVNVMRQGARNYLTKPIDSGELIISVEKSIEHRQMVEEKERLERENREYRMELEKKVEQKTLELQRHMLDMVVSLANAVEERDKYLMGHSKRVAQYANMLARELKLPKEELRVVHNAAILHDIGKIGIPDAVLWKSEHLTQEERAIITQHPEKGVKILEPISFLAEVIPVVLYHHEHWDGNGYPRGIAGEQIPMLARIIGVVDAFDAMTTSRAYRGALRPEQAMQELEMHKGTQFDPTLVDSFLGVLRRMMSKHGKTTGAEG